MQRGTLELDSDLFDLLDFVGSLSKGQIDNTDPIGALQNKE